MRSTVPVPLDRRTALTALVASGALVACTSADAPAPGTTPVSPDQRLASAALADEEALVALLVATAARHPDLAATMTRTRDLHDSHVSLLRRAVLPGSGPVASPGAAAAGPAPAVPRRPARALDSVVRAEDTLAAAHRRRAFRADSGPFARVLASLAAAAAQQAATIGEGLT